MNPKDYCEKLATLLQWENDGHGWRTIDNEDDIWASWWRDRNGQEFKFYATESTGVFEVMLIVRAGGDAGDILITSGVIK